MRSGCGKSKRSAGRLRPILRIGKSWQCYYSLIAQTESRALSRATSRTQISPCTLCLVRKTLLQSNFAVAQLQRHLCLVRSGTIALLLDLRKNSGQCWLQSFTRWRKIPFIIWFCDVSNLFHFLNGSLLRNEGRVVKSSKLPFTPHITTSIKLRLVSTLTSGCGLLIADQVPNGVVAVKQFFRKRQHDYEKRKREFEQEAEILKRISSENHTNRHLIKLLATYEQNGHFHMIFPYAPRDLETYWELQNPNPDKSDELADWLVNQCQGLAEGLTKIHKYGTESPNAFMKVDSKMTNAVPQARKISGSSDIHWFLGRHGDIKPENILWFPSNSYGVLKITDFGIARFTAQNQEASRERGYPPNSVTYRSPECDDPDGQLTGMCDVWALGCVYLVFVTWFNGGYKAVKQFARERNAIDDGCHGFMTDSFFTVKNKEARVKDSVVSVSCFRTASLLL